MEVDISEVFSSCVFIHGVYEAELSAFHYSFLKSTQTFMDVGAIEVSKSPRNEVWTFSEALGNPMLGAVEIFDFLGVPHIDTQSTLLKTGDRPPAELIENYEDVRDSLMGTRW